MNKTIRTAILALPAILALSAGCAHQQTGHAATGTRPVATRPSVTIFPIDMAGQPREDVAAVVALMLEQRGMESIEVDAVVFTPPADTTFDETTHAFGAFVAERGLSTEYALYGAVVGSPQRGVDEIQAILVDNAGRVAWSDRQTRESSAMKRSNPSDPMSCTVFLVDRLHDPLGLLDPSQVDADDGRWARYWKEDSLAPSDVEIHEMEARLDRLIGRAPAATVLVYPARAGDTWSVECATRLADEINRGGLLQASVAQDPLPFSVQPARNEQKVLWSGARSIREVVRTRHPQTDYVLVADYIMGGDHVGAVHTYLLESDGDWVIVDFQNSHHEDFNRVRPRSLADCCDLSVVRLRRELRS